MKVIFLKKILFLVVSIIIGYMVYQKEDEIIIPNDAIRVRIIANSNSMIDIYQKIKLKDEIKEDLYKIVRKANSNSEARDSILNNIDMIRDIVSKRTNNFKLDYGLNYFPRKVYKGVVYPEGEYDSLVISLGNGLGDNWWCVLYPPLCLIEDNESTTDVEYKFLVKELLNWQLLKNMIIYAWICGKIYKSMLLLSYKMILLGVISNDEW